jgi:hypothetical protein
MGKPYQMVLLKHMNDRLFPEGNKRRNSNKYKKQLLKDEVGMADPKKYSNNICRDKHIHYTSLRFF